TAAPKGHATGTATPSLGGLSLVDGGAPNGVSRRGLLVAVGLFTSLAALATAPAVLLAPEIPPRPCPVAHRSAPNPDPRAAAHTPRPRRRGGRRRPPSLFGGAGPPRGKNTNPKPPPPPPPPAERREAARAGVPPAFFSKAPPPLPLPRAERGSA